MASVGYSPPKIMENAKSTSLTMSRSVSQASKIKSADRNLVTTSLSCTHHILDRYNRLQKSPRKAKVVRRINCNVEALEYGVVLSGKLWPTSQAIFPKGYRSRARYFSVLDPTQVCSCMSEILDAELLGPLFMAIETLDRNHICTDYCQSKPEAVLALEAPEQGKETLQEPYFACQFEYSPHGALEEGQS